MSDGKGAYQGEKRGDRLIRERVHDPYKARRKPSEPAVCPDCGAVYADGRWNWQERPHNAVEEPCPACQRMKDDYPAGILSLGGKFLEKHREEILNLARNEEEQEKAEHPLHRIMNIDEEKGHIIIKTTDIHLPRRIGEAVCSAYGGKLDFHYEEESYFIRINWCREN